MTFLLAFFFAERTERMNLEYSHLRKTFKNLIHYLHFHLLRTQN